jgi:hypothetical protein
MSALGRKRTLEVRRACARFARQRKLIFGLGHHLGKSPMNLRRFIRLAGFLLVGSYFLSSLAGPPEDADPAYKSGDDATALRLWRDLVESSTPPPMPANTSSDRRAEFDVGRVSLRMPDDTWESVGTSHRGLAYTGDRPGEIPSVTRYLLLRDGAGGFRAALVVSASWGVGAVRMMWTQTCRPQQNVHVVDNTRGDVYGRDCLRVTGPVSPQRYLELTARDILPELGARNVALPRTGYVVSDEVGLENGTYLAVQAIFAADFKLPDDSSGQGNLPAGVKPEVVAWGGRLAEAVRTCTHSLSGVLLIPPVTGKASTK